ncbi:recombinase family protein, partial [Streptomyces sp. NPDC093595]|uniref:recombinase family protein n=1 Tax=Streptomyces sp. NPDC093595 TaxID=3366045 RepID=UPI00381EDDE2
MGYTRCSHRSQELDSQFDALTQHGILRDKIFSEKISTRIRVRPQFEEALKTARGIKAHGIVRLSGSSLRWHGHRSGRIAGEAARGPAVVP